MSNPGFIFSTGQEQFISGSMLEAIDKRLEQHEAYAKKSHTHLWVMTIAHKLSDKQLEEMETETFHLDFESIIISALGCFICEQPFNKKLLHRSCPGEPK